MKDLILMGVKVGTYRNSECARNLIAFTEVDPIPELVGLLPSGTVVLDIINGTMFGDFAGRPLSVFMTVLCGRHIMTNGLTQDFTNMVEENETVFNWVEAGSL